MIEDSEYNGEPVYYCKDCLSLAIVELDGIYDYCANCGSMNTGAATFEDWQDMYECKYMRDPLTNKFKLNRKWLKLRKEKKIN